MSGSVNKVILIGRLGKDPEVKSTPSGVTVTKFSLATDERFTDKSGERQERTEWHNIVAFNRLAEICGQYLRKGKLVYIEGSIQTDSWDDKDSGQKKYFTKIIANSMQMLGKREDEGSGGGSYSQSSRSSSNSATSTVEDDEEVPF
ncbi:MAG TPA: single-stranded DNA-binding protein [Thermoanaerobaculia bacterium]|nr:single-stranded DNA-binding protein [Thermoanaerobaculia bacterium]